MSETELAEILAQARSLAVVGIKAERGEDAYRIPKYMQDQGYKVIPVNPKLESALGQKAYASLAELSKRGMSVDIVNLFRASDHVAHHTDEILAMSPLPKVVWMQLGIHHGPSAARLRLAGIKVVQDRCIMVDHRRLMGSAKHTGSA